jgi:hypothetical protein
MIPRLILLAVLLSGAIYAATHNPRGAIAFGTDYNADSNTIQGPRSVFSTSSPMAWVAHFNKKPSTTGLTFVVLRSRPHGAAVVVGESNFQLKDPDDTGVYAVPADMFDVERKLGMGPGTYTLQFRDGSSVLSEGTVTLTQ